MDIKVLDEDFAYIGILDNYESLIWTGRYYSSGDFEIYTSFSPFVLAMLQHDRYLQIDDSEHIMIVENVEIQTDSETGEHLIISGRSLESIIERRIVWNQTTITGNLQNGVQKILNENIINPSDVSRKISNFVFEASDDPRIVALTWDEQLTGDNIYDVVTALCEKHSMGYKITLNDNNQFVFKLYMGDDRSYSQDANSYVVFSPNYENIVNSNYLDSSEQMKNVALVAGEDSGSSRRTLTLGDSTGLNRRELYVDARDIRSEDFSDYNAALRERGLQYLDENSRTVNFEGQVEATKMFKYGRDFFMGDVIQIVNEYGIEGSARVVEFIHNEDALGKQTYPTFEAVKNSNY